MSELIDRQEVIDRLKKAEDVFRQNGAKLEANGIHYAMELVESDIEIPTVDCTWIISGRRYGKKEEALKYLRPQGEWHYEELQSGMNGCHVAWFYCSECAYKTGIITHFCPNCGADMDGGEEE